MANAFKQKQEQARLDKLLVDCAKTYAGGAVGRRRAIDAYAKGAGVSVQVAERTLADRCSVGQTNFRTMFSPR